MNIFEYVKTNNYTFLEKEFNEVDNVIFSTLAYIDFSGVLDDKRLSIKEAANEYFLLHDKKDQRLNIVAVREAIKLLNVVKDSVRFKDIIMSNYCYIGDESSQFSAVTFKINNSLSYVAFEGTDQLISGWKEDCEMAYRFPVRAHTYAINYLNKHFTFGFKKLIIGGHSKGGNLALVASMYANFLVKRRIINIYSNDGQGLRKAQIESNNYKSIKDKYIHIIPQYSIVGLLLRHDDNLDVVYASVPGILAHCTSYWKIEEDKFKRTELSNSSKILDKGIITWLDKYDDELREKFVNSLFVIFEENNITSLLELKKSLKLVAKLIKASKDIDPIVKEMLKDLMKILIDTNKEVSWL